MIERLEGMVVAQSDKTITVMASGIGFAVQVADVAQFPLQRMVSVFTYMHWSQEKGVSIFGFVDEVSRHLFCLLITCQKVGPSIALSLIKQRNVVTLIQDIMTSNIAGLSSCQGIGAKKAEQIIYELKDKVGALAHLPEIASSAVAHLRSVHEALISLGYSKQEVADAIGHLSAAYKNDTVPDLSILIRKALAFLSNRV